MELFQTTVFFLAILHACFSDRFLKKARSKEREGTKAPLLGAYRFLGNVTILFGVWLVPILFVMWIYKRGDALYDSLETFDLKEPFAYFVLTTLGFLLPLRHLFANLLNAICKQIFCHVAVWWSTLLLVSAILTGCFSELAMMALTCGLLSTTFFSLKPSKSLSYLTFSLLLIGLAVGGSILPLNLRFSLEVFSGPFWNHWTVFFLFGWKVLTAYGIVVLCGAFCFRKEFTSMQKKFTHAMQKEERPIAFREFVYAALLLGAAMTMNYPFVLFGILAFVIILHKEGYRIEGEEGSLSLHIPMFIAFFTYTLEIHASLQNWWVQPLLEQLEGFSLYVSAFFLTGLNEHVPYLALRELYQNFPVEDKFFSYLAILVGGGLTIFANPANIIAKKVLGKKFPGQVLSPFTHFLWAMPLGGLVFFLVYCMHVVGL